ncbi:hypothetical protein SBA4_1440003 [Candidatus Sulfopaludibacter sp. SbA4]|nr:hypothetical protein SBA4_1440003 [Candidatus Sulfopaludibacter sp. SbA4]
MKTTETYTGIGLAVAPMLPMSTNSIMHPWRAGVCAIGLLILTLPRPAAAQAGTFSATGSASNARTSHVATLLPNGKVLVAGGWNPPTLTASAEIYDPDTGLFSPTGSLKTARRDATATLLPNGKVLIAGGRFPPTTYASAELYDPDTGLFSFTGSMSTARAIYTATLLSNGKVLVAGGISSGVAVASAELYDPDTGLFSPTGSLNTARYYHTAALLPDGRVLIAGGNAGPNVFANAEIYDPDTGIFTPTGSMGTARTGHTATLLPPSTARPRGKVLIAGGNSNSLGGPPAFASAELYDPDTGLFTPTGDMSAGRWIHSATLLPAYELRPHGKVLIAGGDAGPFVSGLLASAELYDPDTGRFSPTGNLSIARHAQTATLLPNGAVLVAEGDNGVHALASAELYTLPPTYTITDLGTLPGGTLSQAFTINNNGLMGGQASSADGTTHAVLWYNGRIGDIAVPGLGGPNSGAFALNEMGQVTGQAETLATDPNHEDFCGYGTGRQCLPFLWQDGVMTPLPTLGGTNGTAGAINNRGEAAGVAETGAKDQNCPSPRVFDFEAVIWGPSPGEIHQLPPLAGDTVGSALWINDNGQAVGTSGSCANTALVPLTAGPHAVLWENGSVTDLGNLGGKALNIGVYINNQGQVVGASSLTAQATPFNGTDAFLWTRATGMRDLGTLPGDVASGASGINDRGEVVGVSFDKSGNSRAFLWHSGVMTDLNTLIPAGSPLMLLWAVVINSRGEIVGFGMTSNGDLHGYLATPSSGPDAGEDLSSAAQGVASPMLLPEDARGMLQQRLRSGRFGARLMGPR